MDTIQQQETQINETRQEEINRRFNAIIRKWGNLPAHYKTVAKLLPIFIILAAIPLTVKLTEMQQNLSQEAAQKCNRVNGKNCLTPTPTLTQPTPTSFNTPTPTQAFTSNSTPTPTPSSTSPYNTFYISPTGSDSGNGSINSPLKTILAASKLLHAGDMLYVRGGTYYDPGGYNWSSSANGQSGAPITVKAYPGEIPIFDGASQVQQALILQNVSWIIFDGISFTHYTPYDNGVILVLSSNHITFHNVKSYGQLPIGPGDSSTDHHIYFVGSSDITVDGCTLDGIPGAAIHIYGSTPNSRITVKNSNLTNNGTGILAGSGLTGGTFMGNLITATSYGIHFNSITTSVTVSSNKITAPIGLWTESLSSYGPSSESSDSITYSSTPFLVGWPGTYTTLSQWQSLGQGNNTVVIKQ